MSIIHKINIKAPDSGMEFILSDATPDRYGDIILADGWDLTNFNKNPIALFGHRSDFPIGKWKNLKVKDGALHGFLEMAPIGTSERIDEIRKLIDAGILKAVSVGFRPIESKPISNSAPGEIYVKSELVETSVVAVPANPNALAVAKSLGISRETQSLIFAKHGTEVTITERGGPTHGKHAKIEVDGKIKTMSPLSKLIQDKQTFLVSLRDELTEHVKALGDDNATDEQTVVIDGLNSQIEATEKSLETLKRSEASLARASTSTSLTTLERTADRTTTTTEVTAVHRPRPFAAPAEKIRPSDYIFKAIAVDLKHFGEGRKRPILDVLKENYGDGDHGAMVRTIMAQMVTKAAAIPADTTTSGWADKLVQTVLGDLIESLLPLSLYPKLAAKGGSFTFGRNGVITLPARTTSTTIAGAFVAQGAPIPVRQGAFSSISLTPKKMGVITTMTREITEHSLPSIEGILRTAILEDTAVAIDTILLDNNAATTTRPAGLVNGISTQTPAGTSFDNMITDLRNMVGVLITGAKGNLRAPVWIMGPDNALAISLKQNAGGDFPFRAEMTSGFLLGYPVITSSTMTTDTLILIDAADFITATGDTPNFAVSDQAVLHMEDTTPLAIGTAGTPPTVAAPVRSLWQTDSIAIRMIMDINWAMRRTGVIALLTTPTW